MSEKAFRFDWYPKEAHTDFMRLPAEEIGVLMQICNLMYLNNGPIENDPKWISQSMYDMGPAKCRNVINSLIEKEHIFLNSEGKISKKMVQAQLQNVENRRLKIPKNSGENSEKLGKSSEKTPKKSENFGNFSEILEPSFEQNQPDNKSLEEEEETAAVSVPVYSLVKEEIAGLKLGHFEAFLEHRNALGKPVHKNFIPHICEDLKKLVSEGNDPNLVIEQSIKNGWSSLRPLSKKGNENGKTRKSRKQDLAEQARELMDKYRDNEIDPGDDSVL